MALYGSYDNVTYFHSYGVQHISKEIHGKQKHCNKYRIQSIQAL